MTRRDLITGFFKDYWKEFLVCLIAFTAWTIVALAVGANYGDWKATNRFAESKKACGKRAREETAKYQICKQQFEAKGK